MSLLRIRATFSSDRVFVRLGIVAIAFVFMLIVTPTEYAIGQELRAKAVKPTDAEIRAAAEAIRPLHLKMEKPAENDWLARHQEAGQTFAQYRQRYKQRICDQYQTLYIQPLGEFTATQNKLLAKTTDFVGRFYGMPVKTLDVVRLDKVPEKARRVPANGAAPQILTHYLLDDVLKPRRPKDAAAVMGLTASDLWPGEGWNFVFGQASLTDRVGVWSIQRFGDPEEDETAYKLCLARTLKVAVHETGHMLGIQHCTAWQCGMNGSNHLAESDSQPLEFCPECQSKLWWTCGAAPLLRYRKLLEFAESRGMKAETVYWQEAVERLK
jgi:archaemetzincin